MRFQKEHPGFWKGKKLSQQTREKMSETHKKIGTGKWMKGRKLSNEICKKMSEAMKGKNKTHGLTKSRFYNIWMNMKQRTMNTKHTFYKNYGGRGIIVCNEWISFSGFKKDMYESYLNHCQIFGEMNTTIDRVDGKGDYEFNNCRWATRQEQNQNRNFVREFNFA